MKTKLLLLILVTGSLSLVTPARSADSFGPAAPKIFRSTSQGVTKAGIDTAAGNIFGYNFTNPNSYAVYVKFYDSLAAGVTVGSTAVLRTIAVPAGGYISQENVGVPITHFGTGLVIAVTKNLADSDATALDTPILAEVFYK